jgi:hypothetical protein
VSDHKGFSGRDSSARTFHLFFLSEGEKSFLEGNYLKGRENSKLF